MKVKDVVSARLIVVGVAIGGALWGYLVVALYSLGRVPAFSQASVQWDERAPGSINGLVPLLVCIAASMAFAVDDVVTPQLQRGFTSLIHAVIRGVLPGLIGGAVGLERANAFGLLSFGMARGILILIGFLAASILCFFAFAPREAVARRDPGQPVLG